MNSIKIYLSLFLFLSFFSNPLFSQNDFYVEKNEPKKIEQITPNVNIDLIEEYTTEEDYNEMHNINKEQYTEGSEFNNDEFNDEEVYSGDRNQDRKRNSIAGEIAAEVIIDVLYNAVFIIATFWH